MRHPTASSVSGRLTRELLTLAGVAAALAACEGRARGPTAPAGVEVAAAETPFADVPPSAVYPTNGLRAVQNNPETGCRRDPVVGFGYALPLAWTAASSSKPISAYHVLVRHAAQPAPLVERWVPGLVTVFVDCARAFDLAELDGWTFEVQAQYADGTYGPWSAAQSFGFLPARRHPAFVSRAPDYGSGKTQVSISGQVDAITSDAVFLTTRTTTSTAVTQPPPVEFFRSVPSPRGAYFASLGPFTSVRVFDNGSNRFWDESVSWNPAPPVVPGTVTVYGVVTDPLGRRRVSDPAMVRVVP